MTVNNPNGRLARWRLALSEFTFKQKYKKDRINQIADMLSRLPLAKEKDDSSTSTEAKSSASEEGDVPCFVTPDGDDLFALEVVVTTALEDNEEDVGPTCTLKPLGERDKEEFPGCIDELEQLTRTYALCRTSFPRKSRSRI